MSDLNKPSAGLPGGKTIPPANASSAYGTRPPQIPAKAKPPIITPAGGGPGGGGTNPFPALPGQAPAFPPPGSAVPVYLPQKPPPPVPTPHPSPGIGLIIGLVVALPLCLLLVCGVGGYLIYSAAASRITTAANSVKNQNRPSNVNPNDPFAALNSPEVQKEMEQELDKAFDKLDAQMQKQPGTRGRTRTGNNSPPREQEKDDLPTNLKRLQTGNDQEKQRAAEWFSRAPLEADQQEEVARALNNMHTDALRKHALGAVKVWGTAENVPMICRIMQQEAFVKLECMSLLERFKDERAIEPLISMLNEAFREGDQAEELVAEWWPQAEQPLVKHMHDKENRLRERAQRILDLRKTDQGLLVAQTLQDMESSDREVRRSAVSWLAKAELKSDLQPQAAAAVQKLLSDSNGETRRSAVEMFGKYAQREQADELLKLLDERDHEKWKAGLTGLIRLGDVRAAERIGRRKEIQGEAFRIFRQAGAPAQDLVAKTLTQVEVKDWGTGKELCEVLGDIGTTKSVGFLMQVKKKAVAAKTPFVGEAADKAIESIRRRNGG